MKFIHKNTPLETIKDITDEINLVMSFASPSKLFKKYENTKESAQEVITQLIDGMKVSSAIKNDPLYINYAYDDSMIIMTIVFDTTNTDINIGSILQAATQSGKIIDKVMQPVERSVISTAQLQLKQIEEHKQVDVTNSNK
jgi:hypothetical protein